MQRTLIFIASLLLVLLGLQTVIDALPLHDDLEGPAFTDADLDFLEANDLQLGSNTFVELQHQEAERQRRDAYLTRLLEQHGKRSPVKRIGDNDFAQRASDSIMDAVARKRIEDLYDIYGKRSSQFVKRIGDNDFAQMRSDNNKRMVLTRQQIQQFLRQIGKRSYAVNKRTLSQNDLSQLRSQYLSTNLRNQLISRMLSNAGRR